eukprot:CAMPEP_0172377240 /NCGR_PEP_ID=MMETSP1060-20121228/68798_1 /TAXON_ID=37318 /ORGANISM="Pseudo-nitzschia pungens, Strain cf. cingulata" /LENGTH=724 /DNA_ID=CAMNT_0013104917 /DNA_START=465 /DNA_END=2643 /DNA_ORIENTATION=-
MHRSSVVVPFGILRRSSYYICWALPLLRRLLLFCPSSTSRTKTSTTTLFRSTSGGRHFDHSPNHSPNHNHNHNHHDDWWISAPPLLFCHAFAVPPTTTLSPSSRSHTHGTLARRWLVSAPTYDRNNENENNNNRDWSLLRVVDLRDELRSRGLKVSGRKAELVALLEEDDAAAADSASPSTIPSTTTTTISSTTTTTISSTAMKRRSSTRTRAGTKRGAEEQKEQSPPKRKQSKTAAAANATSKTNSNNNNNNSKPSPSSKKKPKAGDHQRITEIDELPKLWNQEMARENGSYTFKIASWNVAGLRALIKKSPTALSDLCSEHNLDMLCLQEHKLQEMHLDDPKLGLRGMMEGFGYDEYWSCSTVKKGYSGTCVFVRRRRHRQGSEGSGSGDKKKGRGSGSGSTTSKQGKIGSFFAPKKKTQSEPADDQSNQDNPAGTTATTTTTLPEGVSPELLTPTRVTYSIGQEIDNEGRVVLLDFPWATIANVYVPNSGQKLERLDYRTQQWDKFFVQFLKDHHSQRVSKHNNNNNNKHNNNNKTIPILWLGDLNIAHKALAYRTQQWDKFFVQFLKDHHSQRVSKHNNNNNKTIPILWLGDLNIAHKALDVWNDGAKHLAKQAGVTEQERASFSEQLSSGNEKKFVDVFRKLHPTARGSYSYWSQRAGNREPNKGLRLDYFVVSEDAFDEATSGVIPRDSYVIRDQLGSDHAPVVLELELKPEAFAGMY